MLGNSVRPGELVRIFKGETGSLRMIEQRSEPLLFYMAGDTQNISFPSMRLTLLRITKNVAQFIAKVMKL